MPRTLPRPAGPGGDARGPNLSGPKTPGPNGPGPDAPGAKMMGRRRVRWPILLLTRVLLPIVILAVIGGSIIYVRLLNGAISLKALAAPIARALVADLPGFGVSIDDASVLLADGRGLEFRLRNVRLTDPRGATVAQAPDAAVTLSSSAMWSGRIAPSRIILIEPSLVLQHSRERGFSLTFADAGQTERLPGSASAAAVALQADAASTATVQAEIGAALDRVLAQSSQATGAASFIKGIGLRNATLSIESGGQRTVLRVREADVGVDRRRQGALLGANLSLDSARGPWQMTLVATREDATNSVAIDARIADLVPSSIASAGPLLAPLAGVEIPISGSAAVRLTGAGDLASAVADLDLGRGAIAPGWRGNAKMPVEGGRISLKYEPEARRLAVTTSRLASGASWASFAGGITLAAEPGKPLLVDIAATEGQLSAEEFGQSAKPLDAFRVRGRLDPASGAFELTEATLKAGGGEIVMSGRVPPKGAAERLYLQGRMSPMGVDAIKLLWPSVIAPAARRWSGLQILQGRLASGSFVIEDVGQGADRGRAGADGIRISVAIEGTNVRIQPKPGFAPVEAPRVLVRLEGNALEVAAPEAVFHTTPQRRLPIRGVRMVSPDVAAPTAFGDLTFRAQGALPAALDLAEQQAARNGRAFVLPGEGMDGRVDAQVRVLVPLGDDVHAEDTKLDIKGRVTEGKARGIFGGWDVNGATLTFEVTDQQLETKGEILVAGVPAKLSLKRIFAAPDAEQPPVYLSANLDTADRVQLGLDVNEFVVGEMPVEILVSPRAQGESQVQVRANLTNAELLIEPLAWKKAPGRPATLQFDIARPSKQRTELQNFRIVGEDISMSGSLVLDGRNKVREFSFPELSLHVVSRLQLSGFVRNDNVWDVTVRGQTLDGRDFFQSLFSVSQLRSKPLPPRKDQSTVAIDLKADIDNILGHQDLSLKGLKVQMTNRGGRTVGLTARGLVEGSGRGVASTQLEVKIAQSSGREPRLLNARAQDAGQVFRLIGFFPNMMGGAMDLDVNLDGSGNAEKTGRLVVTNFAILGDLISGEAPEALDTNGGARGQRRVQQQRSRLDFDSMNARFELGHGQVVIREADLRGQVLGVVMTGEADFRSQRVLLGGTYVPLQGLNSAIGYFPILGQILAGPRGEGVIGMTFKVEGPMARPQITVNPVSIIPGILREMMQMTNQNPRIRPRDAEQAPAEAPTKAPPKKAAPAAKASSSTSAAPKSTSTTAAPPQIDTEGGWNSGTVKAATPKPAARPQQPPPQ